MVMVRYSKTVGYGGRELKDHNFDGRYSHTACYMSNDDSVLIFGGLDSKNNYESLGRVSCPNLCELCFSE